MKTLARNAVDISLPDTKVPTFFSGMRRNKAEVNGRIGARCHHKPRRGPQSLGQWPKAHQNHL